MLRICDKNKKSICLLKKCSDVCPQNPEFWRKYNEYRKTITYKYN